MRPGSSGFRIERWTFASSGRAGGTAGCAEPRASRQTPEPVALSPVLRSTDGQRGVGCRRPVDGGGPMYCETCHERLKIGSRKCPNCGHATQGGRDLGSASVRDTASSTSYSLPPAPKLAQEEPKVAEAKVEPAKPQPRPVVPKRSPAPTPAPKPSSPVSAAPSFDLSPDGIRNLVIAHPELLEEGLCVHTKDGKTPSGARFETSVGKIDLLARDRSSGWVVVMVAEPQHGKELVGDMLQLMGWVRKHLSSEGQEVRGIVLLDSIPEDLGYAAAAVAGTVEFTRYRIGLTLEKVDV